MISTTTISTNVKSSRSAPFRTFRSLLGSLEAHLPADEPMAPHLPHLVSHHLHKAAIARKARVVQFREQQDCALRVELVGPAARGDSTT